MSPTARPSLMATGAALLTIGGAFDPSIGSMVAFAGRVFVVYVVDRSPPLIINIPLTFAFAAWAGAIDGTIVMRSGLLSSIVALAVLLIVRSLSLIGLTWATGRSTRLRGVRGATEGDVLKSFLSGDAFQGQFAWLADIGLVEPFGNGTPEAPGIPGEIPWLGVTAALATHVLLCTPAGNWILAGGGDTPATNTSSVPAARVKIPLS